jgi:type IV pilus assembly protein PilC
MAEYRYNGLSATRKKIVGTLTAPTKKEAQVKAEDIAKQRRFKLVSLEKKRTFLYKVHKRGGGFINGEQEAFSKEELELALKRWGLTKFASSPNYWISNLNHLLMMS